MIVLSWSKATRDLLKSFGWGIRALHQLVAATMVPSPRRLPHTISPLEGTGFEPSVPRRGKPFSRPFWAGDRRFWLHEADIAHLIETDLIPPAAEIGTFAVVKAITAATG
jgi:hypothetical protein